MVISKRDRCRGAMMGELAGDAIGASYETKKSAEILADFNRRGGLTAFDYIEPFYNKRENKAGQPTDDSELTAALALSLVAYPEFNPASAYHFLRGFILGNDGQPRKSILTDGPAYGSGFTLLSALRAETYALSYEAFRTGRVRVLPTNGALMRNAPAGLISIYERRTISIAQQQSCVTHIHPLSQVACMAHALMLQCVVEGFSLQHAWAVTRLTLEMLRDEELATPDKILASAYRDVLALNVDEPPTEAEIWPHTGEVLLSLRIAVWACMHATSFRDGLTKVVGLGGDTDTYGAIAGSLLGAYFGLKGIPQEWRDVLIGRKIMLDLADKLYERAHT